MRLREKQHLSTFGHGNVPNRRSSYAPPSAAGGGGVERHSGHEHHQFQQELLLRQQMGTKDGFPGESRFQVRFDIPAAIFL